MTRDIAAIIMGAALFVTLGFAWNVKPATVMPQCREDAVVVGVGDFDDGRWSEYVCGPAFDDFE